MGGCIPGRSQGRHDGRGGSLAHQRWTAHELATLDACYGHLPLSELALRLPGRTRVAIIQRARRRRLAAGELWLKTTADRLGVNYYTASRWVTAGLLPAQRRARTAGKLHRVSIRPADLLDFLADYRFLYEPAAIADPALRRYVANLPAARERWHTPKEVAWRMGVAAHTVRGWLRDGDLPGLLVGGRYWVRQSAIRAFVPPVAPSLKGRRRGAFSGQTPERVALRERGKATTYAAAQPIGRRHSTGPVAV